MNIRGPVLVNAFNELVRDVPEGKWVAISSDEKRLLAQGDTLDEVRESIKEIKEKENVSFYRIRHTSFPGAI